MKSTRNQRQIDEKSRNSRPQRPFLLTARVCLPEVTWVRLVFTHVTLSLSFSRHSPSLFCLLICQICHSQSTQNFLVVKSVYLLLLLDLRHPRNQRRKRKRSTDESPRRIGKGNNFRMFTCTADYPQRSIFVIGEKKFNRLPALAYYPHPKTKENHATVLPG